MRDIIGSLKNYNSLSIIGNHKNVGKTTTLNYIIDKAKGRLTLGLTSIGVDGEEEDVVTKTQKPRIYVNRGTIVATAKRYFLNSDITKEILLTTNINTCVGEVIIFRALSDGFVEIAGPSINAQVKYICDKLKEFGASISIVDGALSRKTLASPSITEATIFCTGAVVDRDIDNVVDKSIHEIDMLSLDKIDDDRIIGLYEDVFCNDKIFVVDGDYNYTNLKLNTSLGSYKAICDNLSDDSKYVVINGLVTDSLIENIIKSTDKYKYVDILVADGSKVMLDKFVYKKFIKMGGSIKVIKPINLVCISLNPISISGYEFDKAVFVEKMKKNTKIDVFSINI